MQHLRHILTRPLYGALAVVATAALVIGLLSVTSGVPGTSDGDSSSATATPALAKKRGPNPVTPGHFRGYAFDQCVTPTQPMMDAWLKHSPFLGVGIYISGDSRACRHQPNLTPTWVATQLAKGWRLLPITLGPQASCQPRFPRYSDDFKISPKPGKNGRYSKARAMGRDSAEETARDAKALGLTEGSTLWYDLEGFDHSNTHCRESALAFLSGFTYRLRQLDFVPGVYSSAGSGILALDRARINNRKDLQIPDRIWLARWDGKPNTSSDYIREDGWRPGNRMKQYLGGHDEVHGGVRINIDSNRLDLGRGAAAYPETHCGGTRINFRSYPAMSEAAPGKQDRIRALQCLLKEKKVYQGKVNGRFHRGVTKAVTAWQAKAKLPQNGAVTRREWMSLFTWGASPYLKFGVSGYYVRRIQRALNAAGLGANVKVTGNFSASTRTLVGRYRKAIGVKTNGIVTPWLFQQIRKGRTR